VPQTTTLSRGVKSREASVKIAGVLTEFRTEHFSDTNINLYNLRASSFGFLFNRRSTLLWDMVIFGWKGEVIMDK
jgi:hypothetical protein